MTIAEFMLPRILGEFKSLYPLVQPRLVVANSESIETRVSEHLLDIGFIESPGHLPTLESEICCDDELQVVCSPSFPLAKLKTVSPKQLPNLPYISRESGSGSREFTEAYLQNAGLSIDDLNLVMEMGSPVSLNGVVETGLGFAIASRASIVKAHKLGILVAIPLKPKLIRTLTMVSPKQKFRSKLVVTFVEFASAGMKRFVAA